MDIDGAGSNTPVSLKDPLSSNDGGSSRTDMDGVGSDTPVPFTDPADVLMASPPRLQGASRTTGGILRGRALGNVYNFADHTDVVAQQGKVIGKVHVYTTHGNPDESKPYMMLKHEVTHRLTPILKKLGNQYSPIKSTCPEIFSILIVYGFFQNKTNVSLYMRMISGLLKVGMRW
jgi:hypothetical protein